MLQPDAGPRFALRHVNVDPAATATRRGPRRPSYLVPPIVTQSKPEMVSNCVAVSVPVSLT